MQFRLRTLALFGCLTLVAMLAAGAFVESSLDQATATLIGICILMPAMTLAPIAFLVVILYAIGRGAKW